MTADHWSGRRSYNNHMMSLAVSSFILGIAFCAPPGIITAETIRRGLCAWISPCIICAVRFTGRRYHLVTDRVDGAGIPCSEQYGKDHFERDRYCPSSKACMGCIQRGTHSYEINNTPASERGDFATGALLSLSNPFNIVFWTGIGTTAFSGIPGTPQLPHFITFFLAFISGAFLWCFFMAGLVAWGKQWMTSNFFRWVNLICGIILIYFAVQLGVQTVQSLI